MNNSILTKMSDRTL